MEKTQIAFITCVSNEAFYRECLFYIHRLNVPENCEISCIAIRNAKSMAEGYNAALQASNAKYKVYLHQDVFILNRDFIADMLRVFGADEKIGLMGLIGAKQFTSDAVWRNHPSICGTVYENRKSMGKLCSLSDGQAYESVQLVDGLLFATQYDLPFREDLFDGWHLYDLSQCVEFLKQGYLVVVPHQNKPWCLHDCGQSRDEQAHERYRTIFLKEYSDFLFPLVSILIPTYNRPDYFRRALESALNQTYRHTEILIGDDSTNDETEKLVREQYLEKHPNIRYYHNEKNMGQFENDQKLLDMAQGDYVNFLMDDDLFHPQKIEKMMDCFIMDIKQEISLVTSHRMQIDADGKEIGIFGQSDRVIQKDSVLDGINLGNHLLCNNFNIIGEPTTVLFDKRKLKAPFGTFGGRRYYCNVDQAAWLELLAQGKAVFINQALSSTGGLFSKPNGEMANIMEKSSDFAHAVVQSRKYGYLRSSNSYLSAVQKAMGIAEQAMRTRKTDCLIFDERKAYLEMLSNLQKLFDWKHGIKYKNKNEPPYLLVFEDSFMQDLDYSILIRFVAESIADPLECELLRERIDDCLSTKFIAD